MPIPPAFAKSRASHRRWPASTHNCNQHTTGSGTTVKSPDRREDEQKEEKGKKAAQLDGLRDCGRKGCPHATPPPPKLHRIYCTWGGEGSGWWWRLPDSKRAKQGTYVLQRAISDANQPLVRLSMISTGFELGFFFV